ncbi:Inner membrane metabolite transport protein YgcS [Streptomyces sp. YIM 130001]|uniref:MFS transporter n=1 Tax=Streptomyces sp. YIM 130001 TaxID=2259644 RepID=UPI000E65E198|nr:MFS transporter [Streptomyces sp. YIM 130001]RII15870.1 Inner membrane metabolite transport protein YgcS [Streptomyces sp. YIM 130001]
MTTLSPAPTRGEIPKVPEQSAADRQRRRFLRRLTAATGGGMFIDGFVFACIAVVVAGQVFRDDLGITPLWLSMISASTLVGTIIGGPVVGQLTDRFGRRPMFTADLCLFLVASVLMFFVTDPWQIVVLGVVMGFAVGGDYAIGSPMLGEFAPAHSRGHYLGVLEILWNVGYVVAFAAGFFITRADPEAWRWALALGTVPAAVVLGLRHGLPESPRWLIAHGRRAEAEKILSEHLQVPAGDAEFADEQAAGEERSGTPYRTLFHRDYLGRTLFCSVFWICIVLPYFAITFFQADILGTIGISDPLLTAVFGTLVALAGAALGWFLIDRVGRRKILVLPMFVTGVALLAVALSAHLPQPLIVTFFFLYLFAYGVMSILPGVYPLEVFPTSVRTTGMGVSAAASRVGAAIGTFVLPLSLTGLGLAPTLGITAAVCFLGGVVSLVMAPETAGRALSVTGGRDAAASTLPTSTSTSTSTTTSKGSSS